MGALQQPRRRIIDYLSLVVVAWPLAVYAIVAEVYLAVAAQWSTSPVVNWQGEPPPPWPGAQLLGVWLGATLLLPLTLLVSVIWTARLPDPALAGQPAFVTRVGDLLRARTISFLFVPQILMMWNAPMSAMQNIPHFILTGPLGALQYNSVAVGAFAFVPSVPYALLILFILSARLGGRIAGWWRLLPPVTAQAEQNAAS